VEGTCSDAGFQFQDCGADRWCNAGTCVGCRGPGVECTDSGNAAISRDMPVSGASARGHSAIAVR
jgi:hypothetical protein